jgi:hypothetical protein
MDNPQKIVISQPWGGLGDNLQYSTLPELFSNLGYDVYISKDNVVRNPEIHDLVWGMNPYVKGVINSKPNAGECRNIYWPKVEQRYPSIQRIEISHDVEPTNFYPKIYYSPKYLSDYSNVILIDLTGYSQVYTFDKYIEFIDYFVPLLDTEKIIAIPEFQKITLSPIFNNVYSYLLQKVPQIHRISIPSLLDYCDILNSCDSVILVNSGGNSLVAAIKQDKEKPNVLCYNPWAHFTPDQTLGCYNYRNVQYFQSKIQ